MDVLEVFGVPTSAPSSTSGLAHGGKVSDLPRMLRVHHVTSMSPSLSQTDEFPIEAVFLLPFLFQATVSLYSANRFLESHGIAPWLQPAWDFALRRFRFRFRLMRPGERTERLIHGDPDARCL